jgi:hypothetical protein
MAHIQMPAITPSHFLLSSGDPMHTFSCKDIAVRLFFAAALIAFTSGLAIAGEISAVCPAKIPATAFRADRPPEGWLGFVPSQMHLSAAGMMAGPPESMTYLVPNRQTRDTQTWLFEKGDGERWLWCAYGGTGGVQLSRRLDDRATSCTVTSKNQKRDGILAFSASVMCK